MKNTWFLFRPSTTATIPALINDLAFFSLISFCVAQGNAMSALVSKLHGRHSLKYLPIGSKKKNCNFWNVLDTWQFAQTSSFDVFQIAHLLPQIFIETIFNKNLQKIIDETVKNQWSYRSIAVRCRNNNRFVFHQFFNRKLCHIATARHQHTLAYQQPLVCSTTFNCTFQFQLVCFQHVR